MFNIAFLLALYLICHVRLAACTYDFSIYPACAQPALLDNAPESCDYGSDPSDITNTDECLCSDPAFVESVAQAIYTSCGCDILTTSAQALYAACNYYASGSLQFDVAQIVSAGDGGQSVCGASSAATSSTPAPVAAAVPSSTTTQPGSSPTSASAASSASSASNNPNDGGGGGGGGGGGSLLTLNAKIGIGAGICGIVGVFIAIAAWRWPRRRRYEQVRFAPHA